LDNVITQGLTLSVVGLVVAFAFMALFILTMVVLQALFPAKKPAPVQVFDSPLVEAPAEISAAAEDDDELSVVAAITVAVASLRALNQSKLGESLNSGRGTWWMANRLAARQDNDLIKK